MESVVEAASWNGIESLGLHLFAQVIAKIAVQGAKNLGRSAKREKYGLDVHCGNEISDRAAVQREKIQFDAHHHVERGRISPCNLIIVGKSLDLNAALRFVFYGRPHFHEALVQRTIGRLIVKLAQVEVRRECASRRQHHSASSHNAERETPSRN